MPGLQNAHVSKLDTATLGERFDHDIEDAPHASIDHGSRQVRVLQLDTRNQVGKIERPHTFLRYGSKSSKASSSCSPR